jgi:hypothetical protein
MTEGYSVYSDESISAVLRKLDLNAISVGKGGNGPLTELAALKEYAEPLKPKIVLWLYYANDIINMAAELESSILRKYLNEDDYSQNLFSRQEEIDGVLINYQSGWKSEKVSNNPVMTMLRLRNLRNRINLMTPTPTPPPTPTPTLIFKDILSKSKQMVSGWGGKMYFVYEISVRQVDEIHFSSPT